MDRPEERRQALATSLALRLPPVQRLYSALRASQDRTETLESQQWALSEDVRALSEDVRALSAAVRALQSRLGVVETAVASTEDACAAREMQLAAVRHLPFLPHDIRVKPDAIEFEAQASAPENLTGNMAFFINGHRVNEVKYPLEDPGLAERLAHAAGGSYAVRARMTEHLDALAAARFLRFDASPTGAYVDSAWRRAMHLMNPVFERFPVPPEANMKRVIGDTWGTRFLMGGATIFKNITHCLAELGYGWNDFPRVLDWGCGAGRLTRYLISETGAEVVGADVDAENIAWCRATYAGARFEVFPLRPPVPIEGGFFDLVIGISVLTHLQEADQHRWLEELRRVTRPGALILLSVSGPTQFGQSGFPPALYRELQVKGYLDLTRDGALDGVIEDSEYYRSAFHARPYIAAVWGKYFEVVAIEDAIAGVQDLVLMRKR